MPSISRIKLMQHPMTEQIRYAGSRSDRSSLQQMQSSLESSLQDISMRQDGLLRESLSRCTQAMGEIALSRQSVNRLLLIEDDPRVTRLHRTQQRSPEAFPPYSDATSLATLKCEVEFVQHCFMLADSSRSAYVRGMALTGLASAVKCCLQELSFKDATKLASRVPSQIFDTPHTYGCGYGSSHFVAMFAALSLTDWHQCLKWRQLFHYTFLSDVPLLLQ